MERAKRKAINFDLDTGKMKELDLYPKGYRFLASSLYKHGFEHRQGSGYVSKDRIDSVAVARIVESVTKEQLWLAKCIKRIDVTDIGRQHDLTDVVKMYSTLADELEQVDELDDLDDPDGDNSPKLKM